MRNGSILRICLVFSDDSEGLLSTIIAYDRNRVSELNGISFRRGTYDIRAGATGAPIAQLASRFRQTVSIAGSLSFAIFASRTFQRSFDQFQPPLYY